MGKPLSALERAAVHICKTTGDGKCECENLRLHFEGIDHKPCPKYINLARDVVSIAMNVKVT